MKGTFLKSVRHLLAILLPILCASLQPVTAQTFGKNKVQYTNFNWQYIQSEHFDVYFADGGYDIAVFTVKAAEEALEKIQRDFSFRITSRIPFVVYNSHNDFQQTNVVNAYLEEGIGGVTELFKNRIVIPFEGSYERFRHVIHHELIHAVINDMFYGGSIQALIASGSTLQLPLWFNEGIAEYHARDGWDTDSDMFLRDASTSNYLPPIPRLNGYFAYRGGQSVWWYIAEKYGKKKVGEILNKVRAARSLDQGFKAAIGLTVEELSERWLKEQKVLYWADVANRVSAETYAKRLTNHRALLNFYNTSPALSPSGDRIAFISDRDDFFGVYLMNANDGSQVHQIIEGQTTNDFEELHLLTPGITWSSDGRSIAFSAKSGASDAIYIIDVESGRRQKLPVEMDGIFTVAWSPNGDRIAFVGNTSKQSDIWVYDLTIRKLTNITNDMFTDAQPSWAPDGETLYFTSDRKGYLTHSAIPENFDIFEHDYSQMDVYRYSLQTDLITRVTDSPSATEAFPLVSPDGKKLIYISDASGINNLYVHDLERNDPHPITNSLTGIYQISLSSDGSKLAFSSMYEAGFDIFLLKTPFELERIQDVDNTEFIKRRKRETAGMAKKTDSIPSGERNERIAYGESFEIVLGPSDTMVKDTAASTGDNRILFTEPDATKKKTKQPEIFVVKNNKDEEGNYIIHKYKLSFSPDLVWGNAGFSTFYGILGSTQMAFSDLLGDHQIYFVTNLLGDLTNSDYALAYYYLPERIDWGFEGFHSARFLWGEGDGTIDLFRYRQFGGGISMSYPIDRFNRFEGSATLMNISRENVYNPAMPSSEKTIVLPNVAYVHDNTLWGMWAPVKGNRYEVRLFGSPSLGSNGLAFTSVTFDYRQYYKLSEDISFVIRGSGGASFGPNAQRFFIGGTENWINREFEDDRIPIENVEDFAFLTPALPLRGYNYNARIGTKYALGNMEIRFPVVKYFLGGLLPFILQTMNAAVFIDIGGASNSFSSFQAFTKDEYGGTISKDLLMGTGLGTRMWFLGMPLKFDVGWAFNGSSFSKPKYYFSLGAEF